jgi:hypothetical protein
MSIESKNFVATAGDIHKLAGLILDSELASVSGRGTYLKALVATTQAKLDSPPRQRNGNAARLDEDGVKEQLTAFEAVYAAFHAEVVKVAEATLPEPDADMMRSRTGFSRSSGATVRSYIRAGNDIRVLAAHRAVKASLAVPRTKRKLTVEAMRKRADVLTGELSAVLKTLYAADKDVAHDAAEAGMAAFAKATHARDSATARSVPVAKRDGHFHHARAARSEQRLAA